MKRYSWKKSLLTLLFLLIFIISGAEPISAEFLLTQEEKNYIDERDRIIAASIDGGAPLHYINSKGEVVGIAISILDQISEMTGLVFEYKLYESIQDVFESDSHIIFGLTPNYAPENMILSEAYLKSETILFINSSVDSKELDKKTYASIKGGTLPEGVNEQNVIYYNSREETLDAVDKGKADYGYGNEYSLAFYTLQNEYKNIITIPKSKEVREYAIGFPKEDQMLISIINKSIDSIDDTQMKNLILEVASRVERKITFSMIANSYGNIIFGIVIFIISILTWGVLSNIYARKKLDLQNQRYELLSSISNEYIFEYDLQKNQLHLSDKYDDLFANEENLNETINLLRNMILNDDINKNIEEIELPIANGKMGTFKVVKSSVFNDKGKVYSIIGKLIDISEEVAEKNHLITKARVDGLTGLYNPTTTKKLITESIKKKNEHQIDALIVMDLDDFKAINDNFGHLSGDQVLKKLSRALKDTFRESDIIGRVGGDEFCVYMRKIQDFNVPRQKLQQVNELIKETDLDFNISVSGGIALIKEGTTYESLFNKADEMLYKAKEKGRGQICIYKE